MAEDRDGMDALGNEDLPRVIELLTGMIRANPHDTQALSARGLAYEELGDHRRAAVDYTSVIALTPDKPGGYLDRARAYGSKWRSTAGRWRTTTPPSAWRPGNAAAHSSRGGCNAQLGNLAGAISDFDVAILLDPEYPDAHFNRGLTYAEMGEHLRAVEDLSRALELEPGQAVAHYERGLAYRDLGETDPALE